MRKHQLPELIECIQRKIGRVPGLHSLILYGSLVRGDFVPGTSDIDFFVVLEDEADPDTVISRLSPVLEECSAPFNPVEVDIAWEWLSNLKDPLRLAIRTSSSRFIRPTSGKITSSSWAMRS
ncbi:nucleotidyltransferase domain-containing protein [Thermococcus peptonophilus]|uniref:nucleotidyltransferase domain-containing protein n=1 Tax=Thermococcus peptonophilus TaxID=53952 RepID=UPI001E2D2D2B|nr:nucleotidyltransferase domain-containing protein [Thermococcus peptonophilus]